MGVEADKRALQRARKKMIAGRQEGERVGTWSRSDGQGHERGERLLRLSMVRKHLGRGRCQWNWALSKQLAQFEQAAVGAKDLVEPGFENPVLSHARRTGSVQVEIAGQISHVAKRAVADPPMQIHVRCRGELPV